MCGGRRPPPIPPPPPPPPPPAQPAAALADMGRTRPDDSREETESLRTKRKGRNALRIERQQALSGLGPTGLNVPQV